MVFKKVKDWIADLNRQRYAGYNDWRLPTLEQAMSLMEPKKNKNDLYIDPVFNATQSWIWTSDLLQGESRAWVVYFYGGYCLRYDLDDTIYVRAVRF